MTQNQDLALPSLEVSLTRSGPDTLHISIQLPTSLFSSSSAPEATGSSTATSTTGSSSPRSLTQELDRLLSMNLLKLCKEQAFEGLGWGDGNDDPTLVALRLLRQEVLDYVAKEWEHGDQP